MNKKINIICFVLLLLLLVSAVSAAENENETLNQVQDNPQDDLTAISSEDSVVPEVEKLSATQEVEKKKVTLKAPDVKMHYRDGSKFTVTLKYKKSVIANAKIQIQINNKTFTKTTNNSGKASINLNYPSGTYSVLSICKGNKEFEGATAKSTVTIKSTINCGNYTKYYKNTGKYSSTFYDKKGKLLKNAAVKFRLNNKTYSLKTNSKGIAKMAIDLKPGKYDVKVTNPKTTESVTKKVTIRSLIETKDLKFTEDKKAKFKVKILNSYGKVSPNKKVTIKLNGKTYTKTTNKSGIAVLDVSLDYGKYTITTQYSGLTAKNKITVNKVIKPVEFMHTTLIPDYVNVTLEHAFEDCPYTVKGGLDGIVKMPKNEIFSIYIGGKTYLFSNVKIDGVSSTVIGHKCHLVPLDGSEVRSDKNRSNLKAGGIVISRTNGYTQIDYQSTTSDNVELFGFYADKSSENSETLTYMQNDEITAKVTFFTQSYDELGVKYNLGKLYQKTIYDFDYKSYDEITQHNTASIRFSNIGKPVTFSYFGKSIVGYPSKEDIITRFALNGHEEVEKMETISYGLADKYRRNMGFEVLEAYSIINEKITKDVLKSWTNKNKLYLDRFGVMNVYGMHLASLETAWLADKLADEYTSEFNVTWNRGHATVILGGINLDDTYLDVLNADMGMDVKGVKDNVVSFRFINSLQLPNLEEYSLDEIAARFWNFTTNSQDNMYMAISNNQSSFAQLGEMIYVFADDGSDSAIIVNSTNGVASVIQSHNGLTCKGASISTICDCCSVGKIPKDIVKGINNALDLFSSSESKISDLLDQIHPMSKMAYKVLSYLSGKILKGATKAFMNILGTMVFIQQMGSDVRDEYIDEKDWHSAMDTYTFTRPGYNQNKKVYNIPNNKGGYDYIEVEINKDLTLNRKNAIYISDGQTKKLTEAETYNYFSEESWTPITVPTKYWDDSWRGIVK